MKKKIADMIIMLSTALLTLLCSISNANADNSDLIIEDTLPSAHHGHYIITGCKDKNVETITIPDLYSPYDGKFEWTYKVADNAFNDCYNLKTIVVNDHIICRGTYGIYDSCKNLHAPNLENIQANDNSNAYSTIDGNLFNKNKTELIRYANGKKDSSYSLPDSVTTIHESAFFGCNNLKSITLNEHITTIGADVFKGCTNLKSLTLSGKFNESIDLSDTAYYKDESNWTDGMLFAGTHLMEAKKDINGDIIIKNGTICIHEGAFTGCDGLTNIVLPDSVISIGKNAFTACRNAENINIPDNITVIEDGTFAMCVKLNNIIIPNGVTSIGEKAFSNCYKLKELNIPNSVTSIGDSAFANCGSLTKIVIPDSVTSLGTFAFSGCTNLTDVYYGGTRAEWEALENRPSDITVHYNSSKPIEPLEVKPVEKVINPEENTVSFPVTVVDPERADELKEVELYVAEYDENGSFIGLTLGTKSDVEGDTVTITTDIPETDHYKIMLWDGSNFPLTKSITDITAP